MSVKNGFSLMEQLVALMVFLIGVASFYYVFSKFSEFSKNRLITVCLSDTAYDAISICMKGITPPNQVECGNIIVNIVGNCDIPEGSCGNVNVTTSAEGLSISLEGFGCNIEEVIEEGGEGEGGESGIGVF